MLPHVVLFYSRISLNTSTWGNLLRPVATQGMLTDEGMTDGPPTFAYLVFGPGRVSQERLSRPIKAVA
jgi:hypothetical protein